MRRGGGWEIDERYMIEQVTKVRTGDIQRMAQVVPLARPSANLKSLPREQLTSDGVELFMCKDLLPARPRRYGASKDAAAREGAL